MAAVREAGLVTAVGQWFGSEYLDSAGNPAGNLRGSKIGLPANYSILVETFVTYAYPQLIRHLGRENDGWIAVANSRAAQRDHVAAAVSFLLVHDPKVLHRVYDVCTTHSEKQDAIVLLANLDLKHAELLRQADATCRALRP
jgi:hypothetical protein